MPPLSPEDTSPQDATYRDDQESTTPPTIELIGDPVKATDFATYVIEVLSHTTRESQPLDQDVLRQCLGLASSFLVTDVTMNPDQGMKTWTVGFNRLIDLVVALHAINALQVETIDAASKACSECWSAAGAWRGFEECKEGVRAVATKLKKLLDPDGTTYRGHAIYAP